MKRRAARHPQLQASFTGAEFRRPVAMIVGDANSQQTLTASAVTIPGVSDAAVAHAGLVAAAEANRARVASPRRKNARAKKTLLRRQTAANRGQFGVQIRQPLFKEGLISRVPRGRHFPNHAGAGEEQGFLFADLLQLFGVWCVFRIGAVSDIGSVGLCFRDRLAFPTSGHTLIIAACHPKGKLGAERSPESGAAGDILNEA